LSEIKTTEALLALADFCADLHEARPGYSSKRCYRDFSLEANIDTHAGALEIHLGLAEGSVTHCRTLLLRVEKDTAAGYPVLTSWSEQEALGLPVTDREVRHGTVKVALPYVRSSLVDIHLAREGDYFYVHLLVVDGDQPAVSPPIHARFQLGVQGCYQLSDDSQRPAVFPLDQFLNPPPEKPKLLTADFSSGAILPWPVSLCLLMPASALVGWICPVAGQSRDGPGASMATLMLLLGSVPFFARRVGGYTLTGLLVVAAAGVLVSLAGFLFKANIVVIPFLLMGALLSRVFCYNAYGKAKAGLIDLEKSQPHRTKFLATRTEQEQNLLWNGDFAIVLVVVVLLVWGYSSIKPWIN